MLSILGVSESKSINHQLTQRTCPPDPRPTLTLKKVDGQWQVKWQFYSRNRPIRLLSYHLWVNLSNITVTRLCPDPMWYQKKKAREKRWINKGSVKNNILAKKSLPRTLSYRQERGKHVGCNLQPYRQFLFNNCQCIYI